VGEAARVTGLVPVARGIPGSGRALSDDDLLADAAAWEALGRLVDARRVAAAAEVEWRSRPQLSGNGLASRLDQKSGAALLSERLLISTREAKRRITLGAALAPQYSLTLDELPGRLPATSAALRAGELPLESARLIVDMLRSVRRRATPEELESAEEALARTATQVSPDEVAVHCEVWAMRLDPDGAEPAEQEQRRQRAIALGRLGPDGLSTLKGLLTAEEHALVKSALNAHHRGVNWQRHPDDGEDLEWHEAEGDERSRVQYDYDVFFSIFRAGVRAEEDGSGGSLKTPHEVITVVDAEDLERRRGAGHPDGVLARFSIPTVERLQCSGWNRLLVLGASGEPLHLGHAVRIFTAAQRIALAVLFGGCAWPGCTAPTAWCEAHHIRWWARDHGPTDVSNGVLLCSHHHHLIHFTGRWEIRLHEQQPHLVPKGWQGPPLPRHRMQHHRARLQAARPPQRM
jgi:hypothetical protein